MRLLKDGSDFGRSHKLADLVLDRGNRFLAKAVWVLGVLLNPKLLQSRVSKLLNYPFTVGAVGQEL